jgi:poly(3-hydroxyalkanoate) synthetase
MALRPRGARTLERFVTGVRAYWHHPQPRPRQGGTAIAAFGSARLLDLGGSGRPVVLVPSLINHPYIFDLLPERSLVRALTADIRVLLVDWGPPDAATGSDGLVECVAGRLEPAVELVTRQLGRRPILVGYCMGGLLALAAAVRRPDLVDGLVLLATPWDFRRSALRSPLSRLAAVRQAAFVATGPALPRTLVDLLFASVAPAAVIAKYAAFPDLDPHSPRARTFVAIADWLADGVAVPAAVADECMDGWYRRNRPATGRWRLGGVAIRPERLRIPVLVAAPRRDRIVPPESALAVVPAVRDVAVLEPDGGHVRMIVGDGAPAALWRPLSAWLRRFA